MQPPPLPVPDAQPSGTIAYVDVEEHIAAVTDGPWAAAGPDALDPEAAESQLVKQVAWATAQLQLALGRLAAVRAGLEGVEATMTALAAASDCPVCRSAEVRSAVSRLRAFAEEE